MGSGASSSVKSEDRLPILTEQLQIGWTSGYSSTLPRLKEGQSLPTIFRVHVSVREVQRSSSLDDIQRKVQCARRRREVQQKTDHRTRSNSLNSSTGGRIPS